MLTSEMSVLQALPALHIACQQGSSHDVLAKLERLRSAATAMTAVSIVGAVESKSASLLMREALQIADATGITPLMHAVQHQQADVVSELLAAGANPSYPRLAPSLNSTLHVAAMKGDLASVRHLTSALMTMTMVTSSPSETKMQQDVGLADTSLSALQQQQQRKKKQQQQQPSRQVPVAPAVGLIPSSGREVTLTSPVDLLSANGCTPLLYACGAGHLGVAAVLLKAGAHPGLANDDGVTPLMAAASGGHPHVLQLLMRSWRDWESSELGHGPGGQRRLAEPYHSVNDDVARGTERKKKTESSLVGRGGGSGGGGSGTAPAGTDVSGAINCTPPLLLAAAAAEDVNGSTALHYAARRGCSRCIEILLEAVAPPADTSVAATMPKAAAAAAGLVSTASTAAPADVALSMGPAAAARTGPTELGWKAHWPYCRTLLCGRNRGGRDVLAEAKLSGDAATIQVVESWLAFASSAAVQPLNPLTVSSTTQTTARSSARIISTRTLSTSLMSEEQQSSDCSNTSRAEAAPTSQFDPEVESNAGSYSTGPGSRGGKAATHDRNHEWDRKNDYKAHTECDRVGVGGDTAAKAVKAASVPAATTTATAASPAKPAKVVAATRGTEKTVVGVLGDRVEASPSVDSWSEEVPDPVAVVPPPQPHQQQRQQKQKQDAGKQQQPQQQQNEQRNGQKHKHKPQQPRQQQNQPHLQHQQPQVRQSLGRSYDCDWKAAVLRRAKPASCVAPPQTPPPESTPPPPLPSVPILSAPYASLSAAAQDGPSITGGVGDVDVHESDDHDGEGGMTRQKEMEMQTQKADRVKCTDCAKSGIVPSPGMSLSADYPPAPATWETEALRLMQVVLPSGSDLELLPCHLCGLGLEELSAAQLEGLEALHRAALARISEARLVLAVKVEVERAEEERQRQREIRAIQDQQPAAGTLAAVVKGGGDGGMEDHIRG